MAPLARRPRADGNGLTNSPCRTEPPKVPSGSTCSPHTVSSPREAPAPRTVPPLGRPPPPRSRLLLPGGPRLPRRTSGRAGTAPSTRPGGGGHLRPVGFRGARELSKSRVLPAPKAPSRAPGMITPTPGDGVAKANFPQGPTY
ncbi:hypothetical protein F3K40_29840 [Streptomyces sp. LBUM 1478]|nr:hypothetical protein [Streptomyces sp. LBUM 1478]MBP5928156.1 hypothetical protein [Streptomyces sp. LBUM 1479]